MTDDDKKRAMLNFGDASQVSAVPPVDPNALKAAARAAGFRETPKAPDVPPAPSARLTRRTRRKTGRTEQFATRLRAKTLEAIYTMSMPTSTKLRWPRR